MKTINDLLTRFDEWYISCGLSPEADETAMQHLQEGKSMLSKSIKDALEACRNEESITDDDDPRWSFDKGWNANITQYDENVKSFLGEK